MEEEEEVRALLPDGPDEAGRGAPVTPPAPGALPALCDPSRLAHRLLVLLLMCFLGFGSYFCYDNPAALQTQVKRDMQVNTTKFMLLYAWYSWPNVVLCFFGGFLVDRVFGIRWGTIIFSCFVCVGQVVFALGGIFRAFWLMEFGRFVFGIGGESLAVAQNTYAVSWFKGKELNLVFGLQLSMARIGSTVNMNLMGWLYSKVEASLGSAGHTTLGVTLIIGGITCILSLVCALALAYLDQRAERILHKEQGKTGEVIKLTDVKDFSFPLWLVFIICVGYYVAVFPFIGLGKVFFTEKFGFSSQAASAINRKEHHLGSVCSGDHSCFPHDAGLHSVEPLDCYVSPGTLLLIACLCIVANGGVCSSRTSAGNCIWLHAVHSESWVGSHFHHCWHDIGYLGISVFRSFLHCLCFFLTFICGLTLLGESCPRWEPKLFCKTKGRNKTFSCRVRSLNDRVMQMGCTHHWFENLQFFFSFNLEFSR
ncbi:major facilitator superfamily domain-containing protein 1 isoform X1 [Phocoena sinus]|uniref:major facilitator superfamily domain-containing protein 1 isoform X1 n=1 Tax=Phocoena sinus TaxID=42100 RepID=UPI0013C477F1|nr:major facilitator superfamily domain-containing protein 1 isoform X1 [Phocoena sinus]